MAEVSAYAPGRPCWVDLASADPSGSREFYAALLGWDFDEQRDGYAVARLHGRAVAGVSDATDRPQAWTVYLATTDVTSTLASASAAGATTVIPPSGAGSAGTRAVVNDPAGAPVGFWQPADIAGSELVNVPGTWEWEDLVTADASVTAAFLRAVAGLDVTAVSDGYSMMFPAGDTAPEHGLGGVAQPAPTLETGDKASGAGGAAMRPRWLVYFSVDDAIQTAQRCTELGGIIVAGPTLSRTGRQQATLQDPTGASFLIIGAAPTTTAEDA